MVVIRQYVRAFLSLLMMPIVKLSNIFIKRRIAGNGEQLAEFKFVFSRTDCHIGFKCSNSELSDEYLICTYILYLARYFYICDDRQVSVMQSTLLDNLSKRDFDNKELAYIIFNNINQTLSSMEVKAVKDLFSNRCTLSSIPPTGYTEIACAKNHSVAEYSLLLFRSDNGANGLRANFLMSAGPDIILLPLLVGVLYQYIADKLKNTDKILLLNKAIVSLLGSYSAIDCKSLIALYQLPNEILIQLNILT